MSQCDSPRLVYSSDFWKQSVKHEADSQVLQGVQARERLLGHRADLVPLQKSGKTTKKKKKNQFQSSPLLGCLILSVSHKVTRSSSRHVTPIMNSQFFELVQRGEGPIHVLNGPGDFILLEIPFFPRRNKDRPRCKKSTPRKTTAVAMLIKLYAAFTFRVRGEKCLRL